MWLKKMLAAYEEIDLPSSRRFKEDNGAYFQLLCVCPTLLMLDQHQNSFAFLSAIGFKWGEEGFEFFEAAIAYWKTTLPHLDHKCDSIFCRLLIFLSSPHGAIDEAEVNAWIPAPTELAEMEQGYMTMRRLCCRT